MSVVKLEALDWAIGNGQPLAVIAGLNVLENVELAITVGTELKAICERLGLPYIFKASFDKANRSSIKSYRGPGFETGVPMLAEIKQELGVGICTDLHEPHQADTVAKVADLVQLPAFLVRQTDLVVATAKAVETHGKVVHAKKNAIHGPLGHQEHCLKGWRNSTGESAHPMPSAAAASVIIISSWICWAFSRCRRLGVPLQLTRPTLSNFQAQIHAQPALRLGDAVKALGRSQNPAVAAGANGVFLEFHTDPDKALCDGPSCLPLDAAESLLAELKAIHEVVN